MLTDSVGDYADDFTWAEKAKVVDQWAAQSAYKCPGTDLDGWT